MERREGRGGEGVEEEETKPNNDGEGFFQLRGSNFLHQVKL